jgi:putative ABC transport system permease protein
MLMDLRLALRSFRRSPAFTTTAVLTLAVGIGGCAAIFSLVDAVLLRPLPYDEPDRLVRIWEANLNESDMRADVSPGTFVDWRARSRTFADIAIFSSSSEESSDIGGLVIGTPVGSLQVRTASISANLFSMLGVHPVLGRGIEGHLAPAERLTVVIGYDLWRNAFAGDPDIVGKAISIEGRTTQTVAGVMPEGFTFPGRTEVWSADDFTRVGLTRRGFRSWGAIGRLTPDTTIAAARADLQAISTRLAEEYPATNRNWSATLLPLHDATVENYRTALLTLFAAVGFVVLVGCANVANLLLARGVMRQRELGVRTALGATRRRLTRQLFTETAVLTAFGLIAGWLLALTALPLLVQFAADTIPQLETARLNAPVFGFATLLTVVTMFAIGVAPALVASRTDVSSAMAADGERSAGFSTGAASQRWIVAIEVAASLVLVAGAVLLIQSFVRMRMIDLGFDPAHVVTLQARMPLFRFSGAPSLQGWVLVRNATGVALDRIRAIPGVQSAATTNDLPLSGALITADIDLQPEERRSSQRRTAESRSAVYRRVSPDYFRTIGMALVQGRDFTAADGTTDEQLTSRSAPPRDGSIIVNEKAARLWWPDGTALGRYVSSNYDRTTTPRRRIIGVVADARGDRIVAPPPPEVYVPYFEDPGFAMTFVVRTTLPPATLAPLLQRALLDVDPQFSTAAVRPMADVVDAAMGSRRFSTLITALFAGIALALAAIGVYGVLAFGVARRRREIGIRMALGATRGDITRLFLRQASRPILAGIVAGLAGALAVSRLIAGLLYGVAPTDPVSFAASTALLAAIALTASYLPVRLALRTDPATALRA